MAPNAPISVRFLACVVQFVDTKCNKVNPFQVNVPFLYPLKTSENLWFSDVFNEHRNGTLT